MIERKSVQYDVEHGGTFNKSQVDKGVNYVKGTDSKGGNENSQKIVSDEDFYFEDGSETEGVKTLHTPNEEVHEDLTVDGDTVLKGSGNLDEEGNEIPALTVEKTSLFKDDVEMEKKLQVEKKTTLNDDLEVNGESNFNKTVYVNADLHVRGTSYEEHATDLYVGSDFVTLREGKDGALAQGERAGIVVNKYDGEDSLGIVTDEHGTLRIGEFNTVKVFEKDGTFYSDRECTEETEIPEGAKLYQIGETSEEGLSEYYYIAKDDTEPVATRGESDTMEDQFLTKWDEAGLDIVTSETNEARVIETERLAKENEQRIRDLEAGKLDIDTSTKYPVEIEKTPVNEFEVGTPDLIRFATLDGYTLYKTAVDFYEQDGDEYVLVTGYRSRDGNFEYTTDGETWNELDELFYLVGNENSTNYKFSLTADNVVRYFDTADEYNEEVAATQSGESENPLEEGNVVLIKNQISTIDDIVQDDEPHVKGAVGVTGKVQEGNLNTVTSDGVFQYVQDLTEGGNAIEYPASLPTSNIRNVVYGIRTKGKNRTFTLEEWSTSGYFTPRAAGGFEPVGTINYENEPVQYIDLDTLSIVTSTTTQVQADDKVTMNIRSEWNTEFYGGNKDEQEVTELATKEFVASSITQVFVSGESFLAAYPVGSCFFGVSSNPPAEGTWQNLGTLNAPVSLQGDVNIYIWRRTA